MDQVQLAQLAAGYGGRVSFRHGAITVAFRFFGGDFTRKFLASAPDPSRGAAAAAAWLRAVGPMLAELRQRSKAMHEGRCADGA